MVKKGQTFKKYSPELKSLKTWIKSRVFACGASESRALGYLFVDERYAQTGGLFPVGSVGHCGHTGQSVFVHPESGLFVVVLSDATKSGMQKYGVEKYAHTTNMRAAIHSAIKADLNA